MKKMNRREKHELVNGILFLLPNFLGFVLFSLIPVIAAICLSFTNWDGISKMDFVFLKNYIKMFQHDTFRIALWNTVVYTITFVPLTVGLGLLVATLLNKKIKGVAVYRLVCFLPYIASAVAVAYVFSALLHPSLGVINNFLRAIGWKNPPEWLTDGRWAMVAVVAMSVWKNFGYYVVIFLAGLQGISKDLYEAAMIDGANTREQFRHITLPMITPVTFFSVIMATISSFKVFEQVYILTEGGPGRSTMTLVQYIYFNSFEQYKMGYASAAAIFLFLIIFVITMVQFRGQKKWVNY